MPAAYGSSNVTAEAGNVTNTVYVAPAGIQDGDLLLICHLSYNGTSAVPAVTPPTGWSVPAAGTWPMTVTTVAGGNKSALYLWEKVASGESGNYTTTHATTLATRGMIVCVPGGSATFDALSQNSGITGTTTTFLSVTTVQDNDLIMAFNVDNNDQNLNLTPPTGTTPTFTERIDDNHGNYLATGVLSPAGATGNKTMTNNSFAGNSWFGILIAVKASFIADITTKPATPGMFTPDLNPTAWF